MSKTHRVIMNPDPKQLVLKGGRHYLETIAEQMVDGSSVFVSNVDRHEASYYKKRLCVLLKANVTATPGEYSGEPGYRFRQSALPSSATSPSRPVASQQAQRP